MSRKDSWLTIGKLVGAQGLRGEVKVNPSSDFPERFINPGERWLQKNTEEPSRIELKSGRQLPGKSIYIVSFIGITDRNKAESIVGNKLLVPSDQKPKLKEGEFHLVDLLGLKAKFTQDGSDVGEVIDLTSAGNDLLVIKLVEGKTVLIPFVKEIVPVINLKQGWLLIKPPPGLLEL
ncbi:ribosome maturation factor RimM [Prochlorococcus marinus]|uniref:Ribosome maturation factor RimM n=1 Tax=Prochlorococcus marinus (strain MIT 9211) TaxID=93059 RepID=RIMM_PROM4|nr:ribosome maturation factor RimM [Prochlorococcus marinus]A9BD47.1 RecName: Full=Ribosome maturation factor RimM [Prochlorococcus marinus str. MIT 9211]ABX09660.1 possible 16S rRNA processing protein RimM [Prochlorococcus marinus str. MIT 9211]